MAKRGELVRAMHDKGLTYEEIGEILGVSRQAAHRARVDHDGFREYMVLKVKYEGLRDWMLKNRVNLGELAARCNSAHFNDTLIGKHEPRKKTIDAILRVTGLTYEECFKEGDGSKE